MSYQFICRAAVAVLTADGPAMPDAGGDEEGKFSGISFSGKAVNSFLSTIHEPGTCFAPG